MIEKLYEPVCTCTQEGIMVYIDTKCLKELVNEGMDEVSNDNLPWSDVEKSLALHEDVDESYCVDCATYCSRVTAMWSLMLGDICETSGHYGMALNVWRTMLDAVYSYDYEGWWFAYRYSNIKLWELVNDFGAIQIGQRIDQLLNRLKFKELAHYEYDAKFYYDDLWEDTYYESMFDTDDSRDEDWDKYVTCSWEDDILSRRYIA